MQWSDARIDNMGEWYGANSLAKFRSTLNAYLDTDIFKLLIKDIVKTTIMIF